MPSVSMEHGDERGRSPAGEQLTEKAKEATHRLTSGANLPPRLLISWILLTEVTIEIEVG